MSGRLDRSEADPVSEENLFEGSVLIGLIGGDGRGFTGGGVFGFPDPEDQVMVISFDEFVGLGALGTEINVADLEFLNLLHIELNW